MGVEQHLFEENLRQRALLECQMLTEEVDLTSQLLEVDEILLQMMQPVNMLPDSPINACRVLEANFEKTCIELERCGVQNPAELSLYAFDSRVQYYSQQKAAQP